MSKDLILRTYKALGSGYNQLYQKTLSVLKEKYNVIENNLLDDKSKLDKRYFGAKELWISPVPDGEYLSFVKDKREKDNLYLLTMWESTVLPKWQRSELSGFKKILVPSEWNKACFNNAGFKNVEVCNLFVDENVFAPKPKVNDLNSFIFCTGGSSIITTGNTSRKNLYSIILAFKEEFCKEKSAKLYVKLSTEDFYKERKLIDDQIKFFPHFDTEKDYANFISETDVFVSPSKAEGWGFMQIQSLAVGRKLIAPFYSGMTEFMTKENSYFVDSEEELAFSGWGVAGGLWANINTLSLKKQMRRAFNEQKKDRVLWQKCSNSVSEKFSLKNYKDRLVSILEN